MARPAIITAFSAVNGLGRSTTEVKSALRAQKRGLRACPIEVPFEAVCGAVEGTLPGPPSNFEAYDSRLLRIALMGLADIEAPVKKAIERWGASRVAGVYGTSTGGILETELAYEGWCQTGALPQGYDLRRQHQFSAFAEVLAASLGIEGPNYVVSTACSSSGKAIASAQRLLEAGVIDAALIGGVDGLCNTTVRGFHSLGVMAKTPCRPFGLDRPGMNVGEGAAFILLEREGEGVKVAGYGESSDAFHMSAPDPEGGGAFRAMQQALGMAGAVPEDVDYVNAHGTGTARNDTAEAKAILNLFGSALPVISTKGYTGHTLGAGGATEAIFCAISILEGWIPSSIGGTPTDPEVKVNVLAAPVERDVKRVMSNSFAFGGNNFSLLLESS